MKHNAGMSQITNINLFEIANKKMPDNAHANKKLLITGDGNFFADSLLVCEINVTTSKFQR